MAEDNGMAMGYLMGASEGGNSGSNGGMFNGDAFWGIILLALLFGGRGFGGGFGGVGGNSGGDCCCCVQNAVSEGFALNNITDGIRSLANGICDSTYALNNSIMGGFHGVDNAICTLGYQNQQGFNTLGHQISDCCCTTQRLIERGFCDTNYNFATQTRDIIENANCNTRAILDFLTNEKLDSLRAENQNLRLKASQADQNAVLRAAIDASTAEIIRRTGNDCPVPAYVVPNPNCCYGNPLGVGYSGYGTGYSNNNCGCGCGCG